LRGSRSAFAARQTITARRAPRGFLARSGTSRLKLALYSRFGFKLPLPLQDDVKNSRWERAHHDASPPF
jgi:hypothetical protein